MNKGVEMEQNRTLYMLARLCVAALFIIAGVRKVMAYAGTVKYFGGIGLPMPEIIAPLVMLIEVGGGLALLFGFRTQIIAAVLALFTLGTALIGHQFWSADAAQFSGQLN